MEKVCIGCGETFTALRPNRLRCKPHCGRKTVAKKTSVSASVTAQTPEPLRFIAVDGEGESREGWSRVDGSEYRNPETGEWEVRQPEWIETHEYVLLTVGDKALHKDGEPLTHRDIFPFLWEQFELNPKAAFVGYFLGYDFTEWLKSIDSPSAWRLLTSEGREKHRGNYRWGTRPVVIDGKWELDCIWPKLLKLRPFIPRDEIPRDENGRSLMRRPWMYVCDVGPFFQQSFLKTIDPKDWGDRPVCTPEQYRRIAVGKAKRGNSLVFGPEMLAYNAEENRILETVMGRLQEGFMADDIYLPKNKWYGPGAAAEAWFKNIGAPTGEDFRSVTPLALRRAARDSYYGGWFEIYAHGIVRGISPGYDINSAYPTVIKDLPCLLHGEWYRGNGKPPESEELQLIKIGFSGSDGNCGPLPVRNANGGVSRPLNGIGWYWRDEVETAERAGLIDEIDYIQWWSYRQGCDCPPPFRAIKELYHTRMEVGKKTPRGKAKKLVYNSAYGKTCQSIGSPKWANVVYASRITSGCRKKILEAVGTHPRGARDLLMVATDGVVFASPHPLLEKSSRDMRVRDGFPMKDHLGEWERKDYKDLALFLPGIYWDEESRSAIETNRRLREEYEGREEEMIMKLHDSKLHSRGIGPADLAAYVPEIERQWESGVPFPTVSVSLGFCFTGAKIAAYRLAWDTAGRVMEDETKEMKAASVASKRYIKGHLPKFRGAWRSSTCDESYTGLGSYPYDKNFGDPELESLSAGAQMTKELEEMLDTETDYYTPDGPIGSLEGELLHPE
jgi:hypothetical protein